MSETERRSTVVEEMKTVLPVKGAQGKPPFRIWFSLKSDVGRSNLSTSSPLGLVPGVTGKFYSPRETCCQGTPDVDAVKELYDSGPKQKFPGHNPPLESHRYGWYSEVTFTNTEAIRDRKLNYHKCSLEMFKIPTFVRKS